MAARKIEARIAALEAKVEELQLRLASASTDSKPWWQEIYGSFANDPMYEEAMRLGQEYRESLRPKSAKRSSKSSTKSTTKPSIRQSSGHRNR
ncbi:MAG TPA: hypothetical protein VFC63_17140 [Blastocatellia bacterium]|nr:hypothetical protein [Blastocatellia bacterium]